MSYAPSCEKLVMAAGLKVSLQSLAALLCLYACEHSDIWLLAPLITLQ